MIDLLSSNLVALVTALVLLAASWPYSQWAKHNRVKPLAAYLLFVSVAAIAGAALFMAVFGIASAAGLSDDLSGPVPAIVLTLVVLAPAVLAGRAVIRRPPQQRMPR